MGVENFVPNFADLWSRHEFFDSYKGEAVVIVGHTPLKTLQEHFKLEKFIPFRISNKSILIIDTDSFIDQIYYGFSEEVLIFCSRYFNR